MHEGLKEKPQTVCLRLFYIEILLLIVCHLVVQEVQLVVVSEL
ncbi:hypothetical protein IQ13_3122 [Lacibacter cauensis]|uniref:Uncharacterized protein n=1 Tax=Lacibacter cauensis TaxID=510947 RepID=A0A562SGL2_9BACT|nr:hypothetical protein IQ13_3122 [Lacibacter cauensis]